MYIFCYQLLCVFPERASRVCAAASLAVARAGGEARTVRCARDALDALRRDADFRQPHVIVVDARQPQLLDALLLARLVYNIFQPKVDSTNLFTNDISSSIIQYELLDFMVYNCLYINSIT